MDFKLDEEFRNANRKHTKQERLGLERRIEAEGCKADALTVALIGDEKLLCDGYTTLSICKEKGIKPTPPRCLVFKDREDVLDWIDDQQKGRRNLTAEEMAKNRAETTARVIEARANGQSFRDIAADEGISLITAERYAANNSASQSVPGGTGESAYRTSTEEESVENGSKKKPESILCTHCQRLKRTKQPAKKKCPDCKKLRDAAKAKKEVEASLADDDEPAPEPTVEDLMKAKNSEIESFARKLQAMIDEMPADPWLDKDNRKAGIAQKIKDACSMIRSCKCSNVCPMCKGDRCNKCEKTGRVPRYTYSQLV